MKDIKESTIDQYHRDLRRGLRNVTIVCVVALALVGLATCGPSDSDIEALGDVELASSDGCMGYRHMVAEIFPGEVNYTCRVMWCESRGNPDEVSRTNDHGLMQINARVWNKPHHSDPVARFIGHHWGVIYDPWSNLVMAQKIRHHYGWGMWACA